MNLNPFSGPTLKDLPKWLVAAAIGVGLAVAQAAPVSGMGTWESTLQGRDINGNPVPLLDGGGNPNPAAVFFYDTVLQVTWLADWNMNGPMTWSDAMAWAAGLNINGYTGWSLPGVIDNNNDGCDYDNGGSKYGADCGFYSYGSEAARRTGSALAHIWYDTLGNIAEKDPNGVDWDPNTNPMPNPPGAAGLVNTGPFRNLLGDRYWTSTDYLSGNLGAWNFWMNRGEHDWDSKDSTFYAAAFRRGDLQRRAVPEPGSLAVVLLAGLAALTLARTGRRE